MNKAMLIGHVGKDPETKTFTGGQVSSFSVATNESYKNKNGEKVEKTEWHNVKAFGKTSELIEKYVTKGMKIYIEGKMETESWENESGEKRYKAVINCNQLEFLSKSEESEPEQKEAPAPQEELAGQVPEDDLPF